VKNDLERMWKETVVFQLYAITRNILEHLSNTIKNLPKGHLDYGLSEHKAGVLLTSLEYLVRGLEL